VMEIPPTAQLASTPMLQRTFSCSRLPTLAAAVVRLSSSKRRTSSARGAQQTGATGILSQCQQRQFCHV
jgi:hypothetical protein